MIVYWLGVEIASLCKSSTAPLYDIVYYEILQQYIIIIIAVNSCLLITIEKSTNINFIKNGKQSS